MLSISVIAISVIAIAASALGLVTLASNSKKYSNRVFAALGFASGMYVVASYSVSHNPANALLWVRAAFFLGVVMVLCLALFLNNFPKRLFGGAVDLTLTALAAVMAYITFQPGFIDGVTVARGTTHVLRGPLFAAFLVYLVFVLGTSLYFGIEAFKKADRVERLRLRYMVLGSAITTGLLVLTDVILPYIQKTDDYAGFGAYFILVFVSFTAYAILRHRLFNLRLVVARSIAYTLLAATLGLVYGAVIFGLTINFFAGASAIVKTTASTLLALALALSFQPLRRSFEKFTESIFYRDHYDTQVLLNDFTQILASDINLEHLLKKSLTALCESLHIEFGQVVIFHNDRVYRIEHYGPLPKRLMVAPELRRLNRSMLIADELSDGERKRTMEQHGVRLSMMLSTREQFVGYILLGNKLSGDIYTDQDVKLLEIAGSELAVAILNAKSFVEIQEFNMTLQARIDHATNRLRTANRHLKELDHAKDEFISMASHQLRTPLTTIKGYLSMMLEGDAGEMNDSQKEFIGYAFDASERMVNLISDLLNVSRLSAGKFLIQTKPTDMVQMIQDEVRQLQSHAKAKGIALIFDPPAKVLPPVEIDDNKTRQVVMNFIDNAIYYTSQGEVRVVLEQTGASVRLEVRDTGIGVPQDAKKKLFTKFYRAENAQTVRPDGTGLGLYLAKRVIQDQGGTIVFNSVEGKGSTFGFVLPLKLADKHEVKHGRELAHK